MAGVFLTPYSASKVLEGVIPANQPVRPNWLQTAFGTTTTRETETINFDREFPTKNTPAMYVNPDADAPLIRLQGFGTSEFRFAYVKEGWSSADFDEINSRQLGQQFGTLKLWQNWLENARKKAAITEANIETLFEVNARNLLLYGTHTAASELHETIVYDFNRTKITSKTAWDAANGIVPEIDLTAINFGGGTGDKAWGQTAATPVEDLITMVNTIRRRGQVRAVVMGDAAYKLFEADITAHYATAASVTTDVLNRVQLKVLPVVEKYQDLNFRRSFPVGDGTLVDIYTYSAGYNDRTTDAFTKYIPDNYVLALPTPDKGIKVYGRIKHTRAQYAAMPRFINVWEDPKSGKWESEVHLNYIMGHTDIDTVVSWKVKSA